MATVEFTDKFVAFVDILGFKQLVAAAESGTGMSLGELLEVAKKLGSVADRPIRDYRSAYLTEEEARRQAVFSRALLNRGVLAAGYCLMALSTPMTDADIDAIIYAASGALEEVGKTL